MFYVSLPNLIKLLLFNIFFFAFTKLIFIYDFHYFDLTFVEVEQDQSTYVSVTVVHFCIMDNMTLSYVLS